MENNYDKILSLFCSKDPLRPKMLKPCQRGAFVYATDGYAIIRIPANLPGVQYPQNPDYYDVEKYFDEPTNFGEALDLKTP